MAWVAVVAVVFVGQWALRSAGGSSRPAPPDVVQYAVPADLPFAEQVDVDPSDPVLIALSDAHKAQEKEALDAVGKRESPFTTFVGSAPDDRVEVLVVPDRGRPYDLAEVADLVPQAFDRWLDGTLVLERPLVVAEGADVVVDSRTVPRLLLASGGEESVWIRSVRASLSFRGHPDARLPVTSWSSEAGGPDVARQDGRAYITSRGGHLSFEHTDVAHLGYPAFGLTSGVAWMATNDEPATGGASDSTFTHNYFGAYSAGAVGLQIIRSAFNDNTVYGFDPHTATNDTLVEHSVAARNGRHGFIFSEGCLRNVVRDSEAYLNGGNGFMIDDGTPAHGQGRPSDDNALIRVTSRDNGRVGVVLEGGSGNSVVDSTVVNNRDGIWVRNQATGSSVVGNQVVASEQFGIRLGEGLGATVVARNDVAGARIGLRSDGGSVTLMEENRIEGATSVGIDLEGDQTGATFAAVSVSDGPPTPLVVGGDPLPAPALAGLTLPSVPSSGDSWSLAGVLHQAMVSLWVLILLVPLGALVFGIVARGRGPSMTAPAPDVSSPSSSAPSSIRATPWTSTSS